MRRRRIRAAVLTLGLVGCTERIGGDDGAPDGDVAARFDLSSDDFWASPFPGDHRVRKDTRRPDVSGFPNPDGRPLVDALVDLVDGGSQGWPVSGAIYLPLDGALDGSVVPDREGSTAEDALVFVMDLDEDSPTTGRRIPVDMTMRTSTSVYGPSHALVARPIAGLPLRPRTRYGMVALRPLSGPDGVGVATPSSVASLVRGDTPDGWREDVAEQYLDALRVLAIQEVPTEDIVSLTVFTTSNPTAELFDRMDTVRDDCATLQGRNERCALRWVGPPENRNSQYGFVVDEMNDDYCVYEGRMLARSYQAGEPPYALGEGGWVVDDEGDLVEQRTEFGRFWITVPRSARPGEALPAVVFIRTGGGGDRPMLDRGIRAEAGVDEGTLDGFATEFAKAGWIGVMVDGPLGGERNPDGGDEQFAIFDIDNPVALRDNLRQSALELVTLPRVLEGIRLAPEICPLDGIDPDIPNPQDVSIDVDRLALMGHSMGATIAPLVLASQPAYRHAILSGAGGGWIENIVYKRRPVETAPLAAGLLGEPDASFIEPFHPALTLLQWAGEPAEPFLYAPRFTRGAVRGRRADVLMIQGLVDGYILPPMANAMTLSMGLDAAGPLYDAETLPEFDGVAEVLDYTGGALLDLPAWGNEEDAGEPITSLLVQHREDGVEGGHEVAYQRPGARWQVRCFLETLRTEGVGVVGGSGSGDDPCTLPEE